LNYPLELSKREQLLACPAADGCLVATLDFTTNISKTGGLRITVVSITYLEMVTLTMVLGAEDNIHFIFRMHKLA
jgi:hypothetical protein